MTSFCCGDCPVVMENREQISFHRREEHPARFEEAGRCALCSLLFDNCFNFMDHFAEIHTEQYNLLLDRAALSLSMPSIPCPMPFLERAFIDPDEEDDRNYVDLFDLHSIVDVVVRSLGLPALDDPTDENWNELFSPINDNLPLESDDVTANDEESNQSSDKSESLVEETSDHTIQVVNIGVPAEPPTDQSKDTTNGLSNETPSLVGEPSTPGERREEKELLPGSPPAAVDGATPTAAAAAPAAAAIPYDQSYWSEVAAAMKELSEQTAGRMEETLPMTLEQQKRNWAALVDLLKSARAEPGVHPGSWLHAAAGAAGAAAAAPVVPPTINWGQADMIAKTRKKRATKLLASAEAPAKKRRGRPKKSDAMANSPADQIYPPIDTSLVSPIYPSPHPTPLLNPFHHAPTDAPILATDLRLFNGSTIPFPSMLPPQPLFFPSRTLPMPMNPAYQQPLMLGCDPRMFSTGFIPNPSGLMAPAGFPGPMITGAFPGGAVNPMNWNPALGSTMGPLSVHQFMQQQQRLQQMQHQMTMPGHFPSLPQTHQTSCGQSFTMPHTTSLPGLVPQQQQYSNIPVYKNHVEHSVQRTELIDVSSDDEFNDVEKRGHLQVETCQPSAEKKRRTEEESRPIALPSFNSDHIGVDLEGKESHEKIIAILEDKSATAVAVCAADSIDLQHPPLPPGSSCSTVEVKTESGDSPPPLTTPVTLPSPVLTVTKLEESITEGISTEKRGEAVISVVNENRTMQEKDDQEAEKIALIKLQWDDPPNKLDKEFWSALIPPRCCPRGCGPIEGKTERFNHYRKFHYSAFYELENTELTKMEKWFNVRLGCKNNGSRVCSHCPSSTSPIFSSRLKLLLHVREAHRDRISEMAEEYKIIRKREPSLYRSLEELLVTPLPSL